MLIVGYCGCGHVNVRVRDNGDRREATCRHYGVDSGSCGLLLRNFPASVCTFYELGSDHSLEELGRLLRKLGWRTSSGAGALTVDMSIPHPEGD